MAHRSTPAMNADPRPQLASAIVFGVMAGKGGVGKTLIACNFARVISWSAPVVVVDLDLYNRGASALLVEDGVTDEFDTVDSLLRRSSKDTRDPPSARGQRQELDERLIDEALQDLSLLTVEPETSDSKPYYLLPSSLTGGPVSRLEYDVGVPSTRDFLLRLSRALVAKFNVRAIIFDCKAGPDPLALAVVGIATQTLLISEYNPITFDGTLNFHRHIAAQYGAADLVNSRIGPLNVVINKVPDKLDLTKREVLDDLADRLIPLHLLDAIPFEDDVFQTFGDFKFVVDSRPMTTFTAKIARLAARLLDRMPSISLHPKALDAARRSARGASPGVRSRRNRVLLAVSFQGTMICVLLSTAVFVGQSVAAGGIASITQSPLQLAALMLALVAGTSGLAVALFALFRD
jgi:MinD-like ATPase involved in chromosome partitioning or flagellar assembly